MRAKPLEVAVIGAGFSGTSLAVHLLRAGAPLRVTLVNRFGRPGRGVAYGTRFEAHLLNVPADRMSTLPDDPEHFLRFARRRDPSVEPDSFVSRGLYGEYLEESLAEARRRAGSSVGFEPIVAEVVGIGSRPASGFHLRLLDGTILPADVVVLALGNYPPANPTLADASFYRSDRYIRDPWVPGALDRMRSRDRVLIIGTGLTMMDVAIDLRERGVTPMNAVSPRGLLPRPHAPQPSRSLSLVPPLDPERVSPHARTYLRAFRAHLAAGVAEGADWRDVVGSLRKGTPRLWARLPIGERARFLRHVRPFWEVHRHRSPAPTAASISGMVESGELRIVSGRIRAYAEGAAGVRVTLDPRGAREPQTIEVDHVLNCTGPDGDVRRIEDPLIRSLVAEGLVRPDSLGLGLEVRDDGRLVDRDGRTSPALLLVGPLLKGRFWEATAVPELREHVSGAAREIASIAHARAGRIRGLGAEAGAETER